MSRGHRVTAESKHGQNRAARRRAERAAREAAAIKALVNSGARLVGLPGACSDCNATGDLTPVTDAFTLAEIWHDPGCPAANGVTDWRPAGA